MSGEVELGGFEIDDDSRAPAEGSLVAMVAEGLSVGAWSESIASG